MPAVFPGLEDTTCGYGTLGRAFAETFRTMA